MDRQQCFPPFFGISYLNLGYKIYKNNILQTFETLQMPANIIWPLDNIIFEKILLVNTNDNNIKNTFVRKWNGRTYRSCKWKYTNYQIKLIIDDELLMIPLIELIEESDTILPFNPTIYYNNSDSKENYPMEPRLPASSKRIILGKLDNNKIS
jgi:hypothetical protein